MENQGPNSQTILGQSEDNFRTYDNLVITREFTEHSRQTYLLRQNLTITF